MAIRGEVRAERVDQGGLADARNAGDADAHRSAPGGREHLNERLRSLPVIASAAFDEGDRARQRSAIAGAKLSRGVFDVKIARIHRRRLAPPFDGGDAPPSGTPPYGRSITVSRRPGRLYGPGKRSKPATLLVKAGPSLRKSTCAVS